MRRRDVLALSGTLMGLLPFPAYSQQSRRQRKLLVWYTSGSPVLPNRFLSALLDGLRDLAMVEGRDFDVDSRNANNRSELMPMLAAEVVNLQPDLIIAGSGYAAL